MKRIDLTGLRFRNWKIEKYDSNSMWLCRCDCGELKRIAGRAIRANRKVTCLKCQGHHNLKHGNARRSGISPTYITWRAMWQRCTSESVNDFALYGGRGIKVCSEWKDFARFLSDMGERPKGMQLDRINTDGNYNRENCRWVTVRMNQQNRRNNRFVILNGERIVIAEAARRIGVDRSSLRHKLKRAGWPSEISLDGVAA